MEYVKVSDIQSEGMERLEKLTMSVSECSSLIGIGEQKLRELIHTEDFPVVWNGTRALIIRDELGKWLDYMYNQVNEENFNETCKGYVIRALKIMLKREEYSHLDLEEVTNDVLVGLKWAFDEMTMTDARKEYERY